MNLQDYCVDVGVDLREAMRVMDKGARKILFVLEGERLAGSVSDGDIRRYLLKGCSIDDNVTGCMNRACVTASSVLQAREILKTRRLAAIPVIEKNGTIRSIEFDGKSISRIPEELNLPVVIMAGGKGTRLEPFTKVLPKPLIPVGEKPIMEYIFDTFARYRCDDFYVIVNYKKELIKAYFSDFHNNCTIHYYDEKKPLGTGGGLSLLKGRIDKTFILTNCDILIDADFADLLRFHRLHGNAVTMVCAYQNMTVPYGVVEMGTDGLLTEMKEKPELSFLTNTGVYLVEPEVLDDIEDDVPIGFPDIMKRQMERGRRVAVYPISEGSWMDMGQLPELDRMREKLNGMH